MATRQDVSSDNNNKRTRNRRRTATAARARIERRAPCRARAPRARSARAVRLAVMRDITHGITSCVPPRARPARVTAAARRDSRTRRRSAGRPRGRTCLRREEPEETARRARQRTRRLSSVTARVAGRDGRTRAGDEARDVWRRGERLSAQHAERRLDHAPERRHGAAPGGGGGCARERRKLRDLRRPRWCVSRAKGSGVAPTKHKPSSRGPGVWQGSYAPIATRRRPTQRLIHYIRKQGLRRGVLRLRGA